MYCAVLFAPVLLWRNRLLIAICISVVLMGGVASCTSSGGGDSSVSGGNSAPSGGTYTPPGTYSIPVTITSTGISHSFTLTLTVD
jgi:hypothetical protein